MERREIAPGAFITAIPGKKFKRGKLAIHLVAPGRRDTATRLALLPHILDRRCEAIPDPLQLSRTLYRLYGAELSCESYSAGPSRVVSIGISGLKNAFALDGEDLEAEYLALVCGLLFAPKLSCGVFEAEDVAIEKEKQADYLRSEMNDKRGYCLRQARRKLYGDSPLGIESPGYLEDIDACTPESLYEAYSELLATAQIEVMVCGLNADKAAEAVAHRLARLRRAPVPVAHVAPLEKPAEYRHFTEPMDTVQGKLCIMLAGGVSGSARGEAVMRVASALYGGLPTSRLFMNVREKQSLCYYCSCSYGYYGGVLLVDSGVDHGMAEKAAAAILAELDALQHQPVDADELETAKRYLRSVFATAKDSADALMNYAFNEWLRGTQRSLDDTVAQINAVTADEVMQALAGFAPAVEYVITQAEVSA